MVMPYNVISCCTIAKVLLPEPQAPTNATFRPGLISR
jgi:hypothetical protein